MIDILAMEYGWTVDYILELPSEVINYLLEAILIRKRREAEAISGKEFKKKEKVYEVGKDPTAEFMLLGMKILKPKKKAKKGK